ncbi:hypothetical protein KXD40_007488 [Peronospora effusa]|uniref:Uncharacterized protein n=1 Tax=Peronospora effusa TaxID=542832 RepID=A0A3M6V8V4_9STRA|nr:hypothetical protein DD238_008289 [Peronospora effusa]RQM11896.1 hypothetical protein DD237_008314 [Peronospora effusa]UIZ29089.1 hypothetical protein KXD40_007488 [Peronospora effusa]CAI5702903.1 unnamed protein product [Peronospora effusa]
MSGGDGFFRARRANRPPDSPGGPLPMSALATPSPPEQVANRLEEAEERKTEDVMDSTPNSNAGVALPTTRTPEKSA